MDDAELVANETTRRALSFDINMIYVDLSYENDQESYENYVNSSNYAERLHSKVELYFKPYNLNQAFIMQIFYIGLERGEKEISAGFENGSTELSAKVSMLKPAWSKSLIEKLGNLNNELL